jgi:RNA polymerase sigma-70 factor (ECF subfamily)
METVTETQLPLDGPVLIPASEPRAAAVRAEPIASSRASRDVGAHDDFRTLFEAECDYVVHTLRRLGVHSADCPDVAHEVFLIVLRHLGACDRSRPMRPWLFGIAYRVARDYRRLSRVRHEVPTADWDAEDPSLSPEEALVARRRATVVRDALDALDLERRAVFVMHDIDGHGMPDIAAALAIPLNTGYSRLRLARADFTAAVKRARAHERI